MGDICTGIEDRGPHSVNLGENECPRCRIRELETELATKSSYIVCWRQTCEQLEAQLEAVKDILYGSKHADIDKLEQIEEAIVT